MQNTTPIRNGLLEFFVIFFSIYLLYGFRGYLEKSGAFSYGDIHQIFLFCIYAFAGFSLLRTSSNGLNRYGVIYLLVILSYCVLSATWSEDTVMASKSAAALIGTGVFGLFMARKYGAYLIDKVAFAALTYVVIFLSLYLVGIDPLDRGITVNTAPFTGLTSHKNSAGIICGFAAMLYYGKLRWKFSKFHAASFFLLVFGTVLTNSSTSLLGIIGSVLVLEISIISNRFRLSSWLLSVILISLASLILVLASYYILDLLAFLGKDLTMSSRTLIWELVIRNAIDNLWLGPGYGTFWGEYSAVNLDASSIFFGTTFKQAHNGFLDIWAQTGVLGAFLFLFYLVFSFRRSYVMLNGVNGHSILAGLSFFAFNNLGEANLFIANYFAFSFLVYCACINRTFASRTLLRSSASERGV